MKEVIPFCRICEQHHRTYEPHAEILSRPRTTWAEWAASPKQPIEKRPLGLPNKGSK